MTDGIDLKDVAALESMVRGQMPTGRRECRLPEALVNAIVERGLFRLWIPRRYGGFELPLPSALEIYEAAAHHDGAFGWSVMIGAGGGLFAAYLPSPSAERLFRPQAAVVAGSGAPDGTAERVPGGYRVKGRWRYASGADYASVFTANCRVMESGRLVLTEGKPLIRAMSIDPKKVIIHRTWDTTGLRATGSHDMEVRECFVPADATFSVFTDPPLEPGPLYRIPFGTLTELPVSAVALGIAQHAFDEFAALARSKAAAGAEGVLEQRGTVHAAMGQAQFRLREARHALYELANRAWSSVVAEGPLRPDIVHTCTRDSVRIVRSLVTAIADLVPLAGMNALQVEDSFSITWRDLEAAAAHYSVSPVSAVADPDVRPGS